MGDPAESHFSKQNSDGPLHQIVALFNGAGISRLFFLGSLTGYVALGYAGKMNWRDLWRYLFFLLIISLTSLLIWFVPNFYSIRKGKSSGEAESGSDNQFQKNVKNY